MRVETITQNERLSAIDRQGHLLAKLTPPVTAYTDADLVDDEVDED